jgi:toxin ParE1/3/4
MTPVWSPEAIDDLEAVRAYISEDNAAAAQRIALRILETVETLLSENADIGRPGRIPGTRELVIAKTAFIVPVSHSREHAPSFACLARRAPLA